MRIFQERGNHGLNRVYYWRILYFYKNGKIKLQYNPVKIIKELTDGNGADVLIETSGSAVAINQSVAMLKKCGRISAIGLTGKGEVSFPWNDAMSKAIDFSFNFSSSFTSWGRALTLLETAKENIDAIITHRTSINNWEKVFKDMESERGIKALFLPAN